MYSGHLGLIHHYKKKCPRSINGQTETLNSCLQHMQMNDLTASLNRNTHISFCMSTCVSREGKLSEFLCSQTVLHLSLVLTATVHISTCTAVKESLNRYTNRDTNGKIPHWHLTSPVLNNSEYCGATLVGGSQQMVLCQRDSGANMR